MGPGSSLRIVRTFLFVWMCIVIQDNQFVYFLMTVKLSNFFLNNLHMSKIMLTFADEIKTSNYGESNSIYVLQRKVVPH